MKTLHTTIPIMYLEKLGSRQHRMLSAIPVDLRHASEDEAPVAIEWQRHDRRDAHSIAVFRLFEGRLYHRVGEARYNRPLTAHALTAGGVDDNPAAWADVVMSGFTRIYDHPFKAPKSDHGPAGSVYDIAFVEDASDNENFIRNAEASRRLAAETIVVDGHVWEPSEGPMIEVEPYLAHGHVAAPLHYEHPGKALHTICNRMRRFSFVEAEFARDLISKYLRLDADVVGHAPVVRIADGYRLPKAELAGEASAWNALWELRRFHPEPEHRPVVEAVARLRRALDRRWTGIELDHNLVFHQSAMRHCDRAEVPDPSELMPAVREVLAVGGHLMHDEEVRLIRMTIERVERTYSLDIVPEDDLEALSMPVL